jgi:hypothetical protein
MTVVISALTGFIGGFVAWYCSNYLGYALIAFRDLRSEAHRYLYYYANIRPSSPPSLRNADEAQKALRWLGARVDSLRTSSPSLILTYLRWRGYDLNAAADGLTELSNAVGTDGDAIFRVKAQRALKLTADPEEEQYSDAVERLKGIPL